MRQVTVMLSIREAFWLCKLSIAMHLSDDYNGGVAKQPLQTSSEGMNVWIRLFPSCDRLHL